MRRKTVRQLANLGRATALLGCLLGIGVAVVWRLAPELVRSFERDLLARHVAPDEAVLQQVRAGDRLAQLAVDRRRSLAQAAERRGDAAAAMAIWREAVAFDPLDAEAAARLAEWETASGGAVAAAAFERLQQLLAMAPTSVPIVAANVRALARAGRIEAAIALLQVASARPEVAWVALDPVVDRSCRANDGGGLRRARERALAGVPFHVRGADSAAPRVPSLVEFAAGEATLAWRVPQPNAEWRFELPPHAALHRWVRLAGEPFVPERVVASGDVVLHADGIEVVGPAPWLAVRLPQPRDHLTVELLP